MAAVETLKIEPDEAGMRLDRWFKAHYPDLSFTHLQKLLRSGQVRVDGGRVKSSTRLESGQAVRVPPLTPILPRDGGGGGPPTGPASGRPEDRLRGGGGEDRTALSPAPSTPSGSPSRKRGRNQGAGLKALV